MLGNERSPAHGKQRAILSTRSKPRSYFCGSAIDTQQGVRENTRLFRKLGRDDDPKLAAARFFGDRAKVCRPPHRHPL